jgi:hypothetical protein
LANSDIVPHLSRMTKLADGENTLAYYTGENWSTYFGCYEDLTCPLTSVERGANVIKHFMVVIY